MGMVCPKHEYLINNVKFWLKILYNSIIGMSHVPTCGIEIFFFFSFITQWFDVPNSGVLLVLINLRVR